MVWLNNPWNRPIKRRDCRGALERSEKLRKAPSTVLLWCEAQRRVRGSASSYRLTSPLRKNRKWRQNDREIGDRSFDLIQGDSDRGDIPESDTQPGRRQVRVPRICGSSYSGWISRKGSLLPRGGGKEGAKKPLETMNDIIEFHAALIPVSTLGKSRAAESSHKNPKDLPKQGKLKHWSTWGLGRAEFRREFFFRRKKELSRHVRDEEAVNFGKRSSFDCTRISLAEGLQTGVTRIRAINHPAGLHYTYTMCARNKRGGWIVFRMFRHWL